MQLKTRASFFKSPEYEKTSGLPCSCDGIIMYINSKVAMQLLLRHHYFFNIYKQLGCHAAVTGL